jgi:hypothetical protein
MTPSWTTAPSSVRGRPTPAPAPPAPPQGGFFQPAPEPVVPEPAVAGNFFQPADDPGLVPAPPAVAGNFFQPADDPGGVNSSLLTNGNFETGDLTGWTEYSEGWGEFVINENGGEVNWAPSLPLNPDGGDFVAMSQQIGPTFSMIYQSFTVPDGAVDMILSFDLLIANWHDENIVGTLDVTDWPNQHSRVDILNFGADVDSIAAQDVVANLFLSNDDNIGIDDSFQSYEFDDIHDVLTPGETYIIRFAQVDTEFFYNLVVDNVDITTESVELVGVQGGFWNPVVDVPV